jgi:cytochrome c oxidase assembly protein subunit 15/protoheme IX farnesyltransferase
MVTLAGPLAAGASAEAEPTHFRRFAWTVLGWNLGVVLWGAYVRASGSGAGCGNRWPLCNGEVVPQAPQIATLIEFTHRISSGVALALVVILCVWAFVRFPRGAAVRRTAAFSVLFIVAEALLGAGLVLLRYVAQNESAGRALYLSAHLVNTQLLLAVLAATAVLAAPGARLIGPWRGTPLAMLLVSLAVSITGAVAALGDTLYPAPSLAAGMLQDFSSGSSLLLRLRLVHPALAVAGGAYIALAAFTQSHADKTRGLAVAVMFLALAQLCAGAANVVLRAPIAMQIFHLLLADLLWIALILLFLRARETQPTAGSSVSPC